LRRGAGGANRAGGGRALIRRAALVLALAAGAAEAADVALPGYIIDTEGMQRFALCRAAAFYHLDGAPDPAARVPRTLARTLLDQTNVAIAETVYGQPITGVEDGRRVIEVIERWFIDFGRTIAEEESRLATLASREAVLLDCVAEVWVALWPLLDHLVASRGADAGVAPFPPEPELDARIDALRARLFDGP
jgi:hypothetical protein